MIDWFFTTLKTYPEIAIFLALALGYYFGKFTYKGIGLGSVTATLIAAVVIGQIGITVNQPLKAFSFLMFLFAVGYAVGPQFVRGIASSGLPQAIFSVVQCVFSLVACVVVAKFAGYDLGYAAGLYSGSQTISAAMGLSTDAINRLGLPADQAKALLDSMPIAYAVTYMFGTMGSAIVIAVIGPKLLGIDLVAACKDYEEKHGGGKKQLGGPGTAWTRWALRAYKVQPGGKAAGLRVAEAESLVPDARLFILRIRRGGEIMDATSDIVLKEGDVVAVAGEREVLVNILGAAAVEVEDRELLAVPVEGVDVLVTNKEVDGKTLEELATRPAARGVFLRKITRGATATDIPILPGTEVNRGDLLTLVGRTEDIAAATKMLGVADRPTDVTDMAFVGAVYRGRRADRRAGLQGGRRAAHPVDRRRSAGLRDHRRMAALGAPEVRPHSDAHRLVHELGRPQHLHRHRRHLRRSGLRQRSENAGRRSLPVGRGRHHGPADSRHVHRQVRVPLPRRAQPRNHFRVAHDDGIAWSGLRPGQEPDPGARLHRYLRRGQHPAHHLGHDHHHVALVRTHFPNMIQQQRKL